MKHLIFGENDSISYVILPIKKRDNHEIYTKNGSACHDF